MAEMVTVIVLVILAIAAFSISICSFKEKGFLFNNAYIYASKQERNSMDKKPHYKQSAIVFLLVGIIFLLNAVEMFLKTGWIFHITIVVAISTVIYAVGSSIMIEKNI